MEPVRVKEQPVTVHIRREDGRDSRHVIEYEDHLTIARILSKIYLDEDRTLAHRHYCCNIGRCASCLVKLDGKNVQACNHIVAAGVEVRLESADGSRTIRDLVVDFGSTVSRATPTRSVEI